MPRVKSQIDKKAGKLPFQIYIIEEIKRDIKKIAADKNMTLQDYTEPLIEKILVKEIEKNEKEGK